MVSASIRSYREGPTVSQEDIFSAPAGWYPDPLGLPQLRWWNNHGWTEQVSAARPPVLVQSSTLAWADDEEVVEQTSARDVRVPTDESRPTAESLHELSAPPRGASTPVDPYSPSPKPSVDPAELKFWSAPRPEDVRRLAAEQAAAL
jgi:Protein of unknown function (DUF2510)